MTLDIHIDYTMYMVVTPINKLPNSKSHLDYEEQMKRSIDGDLLMWDDAKDNPTYKSGGLFAFVHNSNHVEIHMVTEVLSPLHRLNTWSINVGQTDRNVLYLSPCLYVLNWNGWLSLGCPRKIQGTARIVGAHESLMEYMSTHIGLVEYSKETGEVFCS
jgi:hypothetical protein